MNFRFCALCMNVDNLWVRQCPCQSDLLPARVLTSDLTVGFAFDTKKTNQYF